MDSVNSLMNANADLVGKVPCAIPVLVIQAASMVLVLSHGSVTATKDGVAYFVIKISTTAQITSHVKTVERAQILDMVHIHAAVLRNIWEKTVIIVGIHVQRILAKMVVHVRTPVKEMLRVSVPSGSLVHDVKLLQVYVLTIHVIMEELVFMILEDIYVPAQQGSMEPTVKNLTPAVKITSVLMEEHALTILKVWCAIA